MPNTPKRSSADIARAAERLLGERTRPVAAWCGLFKKGPSTIIRWIIDGYQGVFLDGEPDGHGGWRTSREACERFKQELAELLENRQMENANQETRPPPRGE